MSKQEQRRLDSIAGKSLYSSGVMARAIQYCAKIFLRFMTPGPTLELGPAEGLMTDILADHCERLVVVEGAEAFCRAIQQRHPDVAVVHSLFEDFAPSEHFQNILLGHVLEHVEDPLGLLKRIGQWLAPGGRVFAAVPNSRSLHRQAAVLMRLLPFEGALNESDVHHGHRRVYSPETLCRDFSIAGYSLDAFGGYWLKPIANSQIEASWNSDMIDAFMALGERYPDIAAEIYVVATKGSASAECADDPNAKE